MEYDIPQDEGNARPAHGHAAGFGHGDKFSPGEYLSEESEVVQVDGKGLNWRVLVNLIHGVDAFCEEKPGVFAALCIKGKLGFSDAVIICQKCNLFPALKQFSEKFSRLFMVRLLN